MIPNVIERDVLVEAPVDAVWRAVTEPAQISRWFSDTAEVDLRPGGEGRLVFDDKATSQRMSVRLSVEAVEPPHRFTFRWVHPEGTRAREGNSLLVEFTLSAEGAGTRVRVAESGLRQIDWAEAQKATFAEEHHKGWEVHLGRLRDHLTASHASR